MYWVLGKVSDSLHIGSRDRENIASNLTRTLQGTRHKATLLLQLSQTNAYYDCVQLSDDRMLSLHHRCIRMISRWRHGALRINKKIKGSASCQGGPINTKNKSNKNHIEVAPRRAINRVHFWHDCLVKFSSYLWIFTILSSILTRPFGTPT